MGKYLKRIIARREKTHEMRDEMGNVIMYVMKHEVGVVMTNERDETYTIAKPFTLIIRG